MASIEQFLTRHLKPKINKTKGAIAKPSVRKFLGFSFTGGSKPRRRIAPQAIARFKSRVRELTRRTGGQSLSQVAKELSVYLIGWRAYFGFCETPSVLRALDQWIRRRLRAVIWKQRKRRASWRLADSPVLHTAFPVAYFDSLGLPRLSEG